MADISTAERRQLARRGHALPDGSYPIRNTQDLQNAVQAIGRARHPGRTRAFIARRAKELGATQHLPVGWTQAGPPRTDEVDQVRRRRLGM